MIIRIVPQDEVDDVWPLISDRIIQCAIDLDTDCHPSDLFMRCRAGGAFIFLAEEDGIKGAAIACFEKWFSGTAFRCLVMVGDDMDAWKPQLIDEAKRFAKMCGATRIAWSGRGGWLRENRQYGAKIASYTMTMEI